MSIQAKPGETVNHFAFRLIEEAKGSLAGGPVHGTFNGSIMSAHPESFYLDVVTIWHYSREAGR
jgi:hypothetical protein